jgi:hypothetical protein
MMSDSSTVISVAPAVAAVAPVFQAVVTTVVSGAVAIGAALFTRWTGVAVQAAYIAALRDAAQTEAGAIIAEAANNLSSTSIPVTSPIVAAAAARIAAGLPQAMQAVGMTPEGLARLVAGEIGKLQAMATSVPVPQSTARPKA